MNIEKIITAAILALGIAGSAALATAGTGGAPNSAEVQVVVDSIDGINMQNFAPDALHLLGV